MSLERTEGIRKQAGELIEQAYQRGFKNGENSRIDECAKALDEAVIAGRDEAWEAARTIIDFWFNVAYCDPNKLAQLLDIDAHIGDCVFEKFFEQFSASEAIEKIKAYEEKKQEKDEIRVGDEVTYHGDTGIVTSIISDDIYVLLNDGCYMVRTSEVYLIKTGRHFDVFAEFFKKLKEG